MKKLFVALLVAGAGFLATAPVYAQSAPRSVLPELGGRSADGSSLKKKRKASATDIARMQQRMSMNPNEVKRDQQMEILEARSGGTSNTSFGRASGPSRQYEKGAGGFTVRKFKDSRIGTARQKRGQTRAAGYVNPKGKPLSHKKHKKFLFF
ncbi:hypothetical protein HMJ29_04675 [Hymenobacter taeanensis]|uniref:DUF4890 domain-containing protein n=1 Tax=Hymenobacter taeanensis TaxID=2735321 RepID=A0A6M6BGB1_9BACT|nr:MULTISPECIES: hypothetical protein [Hymenobacter]QJX46273.1 hypothetical protein HMJ29_04675 [Hymenobacter taeanensis]UOQ80128.1 hypothetical protein MUN83_14955 [Hymenobacter sp. 5414T-23]